MLLNNLDQFLTTLDENELDNFIDIVDDSTHTRHADYVINDADIDWIIANDTNY